ncbi:metalloregulator ArsR/SmtB family transcription factor [Saccharothrix sp. NRRL B-16314]|uniref:metalloregulator ArsR/SmtB family transcription factor n=1 Tax=Saccharothrix sp. NRRL B-16314 TaxID=1463825 RepID=UPI000B189C3F
MLGDRTRRAIFERVADRAQTVGELAAGMPVSRPAVSQHLKVLKDAGLVVDQPVGNRRIYRVDPDGLAAFRAQLDGFWTRTLAAYKRSAEDFDTGGPMTTQAEQATVRSDIVVEAPLERAFAVFTERFGDFKPVEHNILGVELAETVFERRVGGHIYDRAVDGSECRWARVLVYEPPHRVVFSWDLDPRWQVESDPDRTSEVDVRFIAETAGRTRVELEHRHIDRHGEGWHSVSDGVGSEGGWPLYLRRFAGLFDQEA